MLGKGTQAGAQRLCIVSAGGRRSCGDNTRHAGLSPGREIEHETFGDKFAAQWLKKNSSPDAIVLADDSNVTVYGERRRVFSPHCDLTHLMSYARYHKADYLLTNETMLLKIRRELSIILDKGTPELELVFSYKEPNERTLLYRILPPPDSSTPQ